MCDPDWKLDSCLQEKRYYLTKRTDKETAKYSTTTHSDIWMTIWYGREFKRISWILLGFTRQRSYHFSLSYYHRFRLYVPAINKCFILGLQNWKIQQMSNNNWSSHSILQLTNWPVYNFEDNLLLFQGFM